MKPKKLGHIVLRVRVIARSEAFYKEVLGLRVTGRIPGFMSFLSAGEDSHDLALMQVGEEAPGPEATRVGLYHFAYQVNSRQELEQWYHHLKDNGVQIVGSADHGVSQGVYFLDPDGIEIEVTYEVPPEEWPKGPNPFAGNKPLTFGEKTEARSRG